MLSRRKFLRFTGTVLASLAVPSIGTVKKYPEFNPNESYGDYVYISEWNTETRKCAIEKLVSQIHTFIPPEYCNKKYFTFIEKATGFGGSADPLNQVSSIGWKYTPEAKS